MNEAMSEFQGTVEEIRITVANADLALSKGEVDSALNILKAITPTQPYYLQAREKMANIDLNFSKDKKMFAQCYINLSGGMQIADKKYFKECTFYS